MNVKQKFNVGDLVRVTTVYRDDNQKLIRQKDNGIVTAAYFNTYTYNNNQPSYVIFFKGQGQVRWFREYRMRLIAHDQHELLETWRNEISKPVVKPKISLMDYCKMKSLIKL